LGEIGLNLLVLEYGDTAIAVDCGVMFPDEQMYGIDVAIPDVSYLRALGDRFRAIFLTHGHEDHIGALPYVLPGRSVPVFGTPLTLGFVGDRLRGPLRSPRRPRGAEPHHPRRGRARSRTAARPRRHARRPRAGTRPAARAGRATDGRESGRGDFRPGTHRHECPQAGLARP